MKKTIKKLVKKIPIAFTKNQQYDRQTNLIIKQVCTLHTNCVDIGAHKGEVLDIMLKYASAGTHYAFEPIPAMYLALKEKYSANANSHISDIALSDTKGTSTFNFVISNPSYSGLIKRKYDRQNEEDTVIEVKTDLLDNVLPPDYKVDLMKIDVEGGEYLVMKGALNTIKKYKPVIIFEHGLGASDCYGSTPVQVYELLTGCGLSISTLKGWLKKKIGLSQKEFEDLYNSNKEYYFIASAR
jgi:FkbM family methyltransferase